MNVPEINEVKEILKQMKDQKFLLHWELPYENLLTRRTAAIFFLTPSSDDGDLRELESRLGSIPNFSYRLNSEKKLSDLKYRLTFSEEEKVKNEQAQVTH